MHGVDAEIAGADPADDGVEVGAVAIDQGAGGMDRVTDRLHVRLEQAAGVGVGDHHCGDVGSQPRLQRFKVDAAILRCWDVLDPVAAEGRSRRVGAMGAFRHQDDLAGIASGFERRADAEQAAQLAMSAGLGAHGHAMHAGKVNQP